MHPALRHRPLVWGALAGVLAVGAVALGWRGADYPAHLFRVALVETNGLSLWNNHWFGGHHTLGYGIVVPFLGAVVGVWALSVVAAVLGAWLFSVVLRTALGAPRPLAEGLFAVGTLTNVVVGRVPFAVGLAVGLAAVLAQQHRRPALAGLLSVLTVFASPVAGVFLAVAWLAWGLTAVRSERLVFAGLVAASSVPVLVMAVVYPQGGDFPFRWSAMVWLLSVCVFVALVAGKQHPRVRWAAAVYAVLVLGAFVVPSPLGGNVARFGMYFAAPVVLAMVPSRRRLLLAAVPVLMVWQWAPAVDGIVHAPRDPSTKESYYRPIVAYLRSVDAEITRVEVVPTERHWEAYYVALEFPIARGWERQLDRRFNEVLYEEELTAAEYQEWLLDSGVTYVALASAPLDPGGVAEARLLERGMPYLTLVWHDAQWRVWELDAARDLLDGPAEVVEVGTDQIVIRVFRPGDVVVRVRASAYWQTDPSTCVEATDDGWMIVRDARPGILTLHLEGSDLLPLEDPCESYEDSMPTIGE